MSHDLFAAFGSSPHDEIRPVQTAQQSYSGDECPWGGTASNPITQQEEITQSSTDLVGEDDEFGDFEDASASASASVDTGSAGLQGVFQSHQTTEVGRMKTEPFPPETTSKTHDQAAPLDTNSKQKNIGQHPFAGRMDLLFEAGDDEYDAGADELGDLSNNPEAAMAYSKRIIAEQEARNETEKLPSPGPTLPQTSNTKPVKVDAKPVRNKLKKKSGYVPQPEVLFDADDVSQHESEGDGFGEFEDWNEIATSETSQTAKAALQKETKMPSIDLLGLKEEAPTSFRDGREISTSNGSQLHIRSKTTTTRQTSTISSPAVEEDEDEWDDFEAAPPAQLPTTSTLATSATLTLHTDPPKASSPQPEDAHRPTNVPPPAVLLTLFPSLFSAADEALFDTMAKLDLKQRQMLLAHPASHKFLKGYLGHCTVLGHIIAGRRSRWKRDQRLAQSMRIGPAAAGGKGGMKLTGIDKTEVAKEDREVLDVVRTWKAQVGKLRTAVTAASSAPAMPKLPSVPDISEQMPVKALKQSEGGITAPHVCALCGLRREERVAKVDLEVEDSFGEWWVKDVNMHLSCKKFWEEFERKLKSR